MQFNRYQDGPMEPLPKPSIDTGMGLERVAAVLQGKYNNYDSDLFEPIISRLETLSGRSYGKNKADDTAMRVIADHARAACFLVADGVLPSNEGRGYVLRRVLRRAIRFGRNLGMTGPFLHQACTAVVDSMIGAYPRLTDTSELLEKVVNNEEARFGETLEHGLTMLDQEIARQQGQADDRELPAVRRPGDHVAGKALPERVRDVPRALLLHNNPAERPPLRARLWPALARRRSRSCGERKR